MSVSSLKLCLGKTRDGQYTQQIRQLAARLDLRPPPRGSARTRGEGEHEFIYRLMSGSQMNELRTISNYKRIYIIYVERTGVSMGCLTTDSSDFGFHRCE